MRNILGTLILAIVFVFCNVSYAAQNINWELAALDGQKITLIDKKTIEIYQFSNGFAITTWGTKGGAIASPAFYWRIEGDLLIISEKQRTPAIVEFSLQAIEGSVLTVKTKTGKLKKFKISKI